MILKAVCEVSIITAFQHVLSRVQIEGSSKLFQKIDNRETKTHIGTSISSAVFKLLQKQLAAPWCNLPFLLNW
jgi:hypothetical protein